MHTACTYFDNKNLKLEAQSNLQQLAITLQTLTETSINFEDVFLRKVKL